MKKIFYLAIAALAAVLLTGCAEFLDVKSQNAYTTDTFFSTDEQVMAAVNAFYYDLNEEKGYAGNLHWDNCATTIMIACRPASNAWVNSFHLEYNGDDADLPAMFTMYYRNIARTNWMISSLLQKEAKQGLTYVENRSLGEAYFYRAFWHYLAAYHYGCKEQGVPFVAYEEYDGDYDYSIPPQLPSITDNFAQIISDFEAAKARLPKISEYSQEELGRAQQQACVAMEARIYSYWATWDASQWDNVIKAVDLLENTYGRRLTDTYEELFTDEPSKFFSSEYCWGEPCLGTGQAGGGNWFYRFLTHDNIAPEIDGWGEYKTSKNFYDDLLEDGEGNDRLVRNVAVTGQTLTFIGRQITLAYTYGDASATGYWIHKWDNAATHGPEGEGVYWKGRNVNMMFHYIRFADCLLLRAEANLNKGNVGKATEDINRVRQRSNLAPVTTATWKDLFHERRCELAFEGLDYCYECKRWALSGAPEIKALAIAELESHPTVGIFEKDANGNWIMTGEGPYQRYIPSTPKKWADHKICYPYPSTEITKSNGALKQNPGY